MNKVKVLLIIMFCLLFLFGCSKAESKPGTEKSGKQQISNDLITEIKDAVNKGNYEKFKEVFLDSSKDKFTQEDFDNLKAVMDDSNKSCYYVFPGKDNKMIALKMYKMNNNYYIDKVATIPEEISYYVQNAVDPIALELSDPTNANISSMLSNMAYIYSVQWSPDNTSVAFVKGDTVSFQGQMFLWKTGEKKAKVIENVNFRICKFYWSPDSEYVIADAGTYVTRMGYLVSKRDSKLVREFGYVGPICWSPDSKMFATGKESDAEHDSDYDVLSDFVIYNVETGESKIIDKAIKDTSLSAEKWNSDGNITYLRHYLSENNKTKTLIYKYK